MKIGIVTITDLTNYGNRLQNYAMYHMLIRDFQCKAVSLTTNKGKRFCNGNYKAWLKERIAGLSCRFPTWAEKRFGNQITRWENFRKWNKLIPSKTYYGCSKIPETVKKFDYFVAGSDQIWNYNFSEKQFDDYFLKFTKTSKKLAVSASFGVDELPNEWKPLYKSSLQDFSRISVREEAGRMIVKDLIGIDVPVLIDPTMMLSREEWLKVSKKPRVDCSKPYILKYYLGDEAEEEKIDNWAKQNGYVVYELLNEKIPELYSAGPGEFISLISKAALVCSDSFHCIVFSIIFERPFLVYARRGSENYMTSRLDTLLGKFGFQNRWKHLTCQQDYLNCDYSLVPDLLKKEQQYFWDYMNSVLK